MACNTACLPLEDVLVGMSGKMEVLNLISVTSTAVAKYGGGVSGTDGH